MRLGISVYCGFKEYPIEKTLKYLEYAKSLGYTHVFSSLHIKEAGDILDQFKIMAAKCEELGLILNTDISKPTYEKLYPITNISRLRLDYGFEIDEMVDMSNNAPFTIEFNASTATEQEVKSLIEKGMNPNRTSYSFNFYPKLYSGHDLEFVKNQTAMLHKYGFEVYAFIPSQTGLRAPLYEGLPTIEHHRKMNIDLACEELKACGLDGIYFGDAYASKEELQQVLLHAISNEVALPLELNDSKYDYLYLDQQRIRRDYNSYILRFNNRNVMLPIEKNNAVARSKYDLTLDNDGFMRYAGEFNICYCDLPQDDRVNIIGKVSATDVILENIKHTLRVKFIKVGNK